jgi:hypothetical protein
MANPFPDKDLKKIMVPDGATGIVAYPSMKQQSLTKPSGLTAGKKWGFCIILHPFADTSSDEMGPYTPTGPSTLNTVAPTVINPLNGYQAGFCFDDDGQDLNLLTLSPVTGVHVPLPSGIELANDDIQSETYKVVGQGFEASDVTPELYKGGTLSMAEYEPQVESGQCQVTRSGPVTAREVVAFVSNWPWRYSQMPKSKTFVTWPAPKGCYVPNTFRRNKNHQFTQKKFVTPLIAAQSSNNSQSVRFGEAFRDNGFKIKVIVFRGLDPNAAFNLRRVLYFECQVAPESALYLLAENEPPFDPEFNKFVTEIASNMPVGTYFKGNALGSWFDTVCDVVANIGTAVSSFAPGPIGLIASGVANAAGWAKGVNSSFRSPAAAENVPPTVAVQEEADFYDCLSAFEANGISAIPRNLRNWFKGQLRLYKEKGGKVYRGGRDIVAVSAADGANPKQIKPYSDTFYRFANERQNRGRGRGRGRFRVSQPGRGFGRARGKRGNGKGKRNGPGPKRGRGGGNNNQRK